MRHYVPLFDRVAIFIRHAVCSLLQPSDVLRGHSWSKARSAFYGVYEELEELRVRLAEHLPELVKAEVDHSARSRCCCGGWQYAAMRREECANPCAWDTDAQRVAEAHRDQVLDVIHTDFHANPMAILDRIYGIIGMDIGASQSESREFDGLDDPPIVTRDVPPGVMVAGVPAVVKKVLP